MNKHILIGHVGKDPEVRYLASGDPVANFSLATSERWKDKSTGERREKTEWHQIVAYGALAKVVQDYVVKGKQLYLEGPSHTEEWTDRNGAKRTTVKVTAKSIELLGGGTRSDDDDATGHAPSTARTDEYEPVVSAGRNRKEADHGDDDEIPF
jgi:single-strand DNA-binding protein